MYQPNKNKLLDYLRGSGEAKHFDWHAWLRELSDSEKEELRSEILSVDTRHNLSDYARQFYLHFCTENEDARLRDIEHAFVTAQIEDRPPQEVAEHEDLYFERARELLRLQESDKNGN